MNSSSIIRTLLIRGLIERTADPKDERIYLYKPTIELQAMLGVKSIEDLPEWKEVTAEFAAFEEQEKQSALSADLDGEAEKDGPIE